jgi:microcystin degradation protein MlrC
MKIAVGMIMQETNSFSTIKTDIGDFLYSPLVPLLEDHDLIGEHRGKKTEIGGFIEVCEENDVEILPTIATFAVTSGNVTERAFRWLKHLLLGKLKQVEDLDGVLLALHGSMVAEALDDPDGAILAEVRKLVGERVCLGCSLDLHANVTEQMIANADVLIGYETHSDYEVIGRRTAQKVIHCIRNGIKPHRCLRKIPAVFGAHEYVLEQKRRMEKEKGVLSISVFDDNPWTDVEEYGPAVVVVTEGRKELGEKLCEELAGAFWDVRDKAVVDLVPIAEAIERVKRSEGGPTVLVESGDLIGGGGAGDSVAVLDGLLRSGITSIATVIYDPVAVSKAFEVGSGRACPERSRREIEIDIGGRHEYEGSFPVRFKGSIRLLYDGKYVLKGIPYEGVSAFLGKTAVISSGDTDVVLTSKRIYPQGSAVFDALNMDVSGKKVITLKGFSAGSDRPAFDFPVKEVIQVDTPGWTNWDFCSVPYKKIKRPIYPIDPI